MTYEIEVVERQEDDAAVVRGSVTHDLIGDFLGVAFGEVMAVVGPTGTVTGPAFARYNVTETGFDIEAGFPVADPIEATGRVEPTTLPGGLAATTIHTGPYEGLGAAYSAMEDWLDASIYEPSGAPWEAYLDGPEVPEPRTLVSWPCRRT